MSNLLRNLPLSRSLVSVLPPPSPNLSPPPIREVLILPLHGGFSRLAARHGSHELMDVGPRHRGHGIQLILLYLALESSQNKPLLLAFPSVFDIHLPNSRQLGGLFLSVLSVYSCDLGVPVGFFSGFRGLPLVESFGGVVEGSGFPADVEVVAWGDVGGEAELERCILAECGQGWAESHVAGGHDA